MPVESDYPVPGASTKALPVDVNVLYLSANDRGQRVSYRHNALIDNGTRATWLYSPLSGQVGLSFFSWRYQDDASRT
jgi:hypothetical protein